MNIEKAFEILGIDITDNKNSIKSAYRKKLVDANPEDKPEEFKILREAYEYAIKNIFVFDVNKVKNVDYIKTELVKDNLIIDNLEQDGKLDTLDESVDNKIKSEFDIFLDRIKNIYDDINVRFDLKTWKKVLSDPICCALDSYEIVRKRIIYFLIDNNILNKSVWNLIDKTFNITKERQQLIEKYSDEYINKIVNFINDYNEYYFELLIYTVDDYSSANPDLYLSNYIELVNYTKKLETEIGYGEIIGEIKRNIILEELNNRLSIMKDCGVYHPYEEIYKLKIYTILGDKDKQEILCKKVSENKNKYDISEKERLLVDYQISLSYLDRDEEEKAFNVWKQIEEVDPFDYDMNISLIRYYIKREQYLEARNNLSNILDWNNINDKKIVDIKKAIDSNLLVPFYDSISDKKGYDSLTYEETIYELCLCYIELDMTHKADDILRFYKDDLKKLDYEYNFINGIVLLTKRKYKSALKYYETLNEIISNIVDDGSVKIKRIIKKQSFVNCCLAEIYFNLNEKEKMISCCNEAVKFSNSIQERFVIQNKQIEYYKNFKMYEEAIDVCKELIEYKYNSDLEYVLLQELYFLNKQYYSVLDNYYINENISKNKDWYIYVVESCINLGREELALKILDKAKRNKIKLSVRMILDECRCKGHLTRDNNEKREIFNILKDIYANYGNKSLYEWDIDDLSDVTFLMWETIVNVDENDSKNSIEETFKINPNNGKHRLAYAIYLANNRSYRKAIEHLLELPNDFQEDVDVLLWYARCYDCIRENDKALEYYIKILEKKSVYYESCRWVALYYKNKYLEDKNNDNYDKAIEFISRQINNSSESYNYYIRANIYLVGLEYLKAAEDAKKCLEFYNSTEDLSLLGRCYEKIGEYDKALECFSQIDFYKLDDEDIINYISMSSCYLAKEEYEKALEILNDVSSKFELERVDKNPAELLKRTKDNVTKYFLQRQVNDDKLLIGKPIYKQLGFTYELTGDNYKALSNYELCSDIYIKSMFDVCYRLADIERGYAYFDNYINSNNDLNLRFRVYVDKINVIIMEFANYKLALKVIDEALNRVYNYEHIFILMGLKTKNYLLMNDLESAVMCAKDAMKHYNEKIGVEINGFLSDRFNYDIRNITYGYIKIALGEIDEAIELFQNVYNKNNKIKCKDKDSAIPSLELAYVYMINNDSDNAKKYFKKALEYYPISIEAKKGLSLLNVSGYEDNNLSADKNDITYQIQENNQESTVAENLENIEDKDSIEEKAKYSFKTKGESRMMQLLRNKEKNNDSRN